MNAQIDANRKAAEEAAAQHPVGALARPVGRVKLLIDIPDSRLTARRHALTSTSNVTFAKT